MADGTAIAPPAAAGLRLVAPTVLDVARMCLSMRPDEIDQWRALTGAPDYDPNAAASALIATMGDFAFCLLDADGQPVLVGGFIEQRPAVFEAWLAGTVEGWERHWRAITRHSKRCIDGLLASGRAHRVQVHALTTRTAAHAWYERIGLVSEGVRPAFFADGRDAAEFAKVRRG